MDKNEKNWITDILDKAAKEVCSWPSWMQKGRVRVSEPTIDKER
jgi:hypothetical protein